MLIPIYKKYEYKPNADSPLFIISLISNLLLILITIGVYIDDDISFIYQGNDIKKIGCAITMGISIVSLNISMIQKIQTIKVIQWINSLMSLGLVSSAYPLTIKMALISSQKLDTIPLRYGIVLRRNWSLDERYIEALRIKKVLKVLDTHQIKEIVSKHSTMKDSIDAVKEAMRAAIEAKNKVPVSKGWWTTFSDGLYTLFFGDYYIYTWIVVAGIVLLIAREYIDPWAQRELRRLKPYYNEDGTLTFPRNERFEESLNRLSEIERQSSMGGIIIGRAAVMATKKGVELTKLRRPDLIERTEHPVLNLIQQKACTRMNLFNQMEFYKYCLGLNRNMERRNKSVNISTKMYEGVPDLTHVSKQIYTNSSFFIN